MMLTLCGAVGLASRDGQASDIPLPAKSLALLAFLTLEPGSHGRDELSSLLWGDSTDEKAHASLRQALKQLRDVLGEQLRTDRLAVELDPSMPCDVTRFQSLVAANDERAIDIDIPRFLATLAIRDAQLFDEWADRTRQSLLRQYRRAVAHAARAVYSRREWPRALELARRWQALDPLSDDAVHLCIEVLHLQGERDAALATYREFRALRKRETGNEPGLAVRELAARIEQSAARPTPVRTATVRQLTLPSFDAGLIGREREWDALQQAWARVVGGDSVVVLLEGESGIGKSRLVDDFLRYVSTHDATVLRGRAFEAGLDMPFGPMLDVLRDAIVAPGAAGTDGVWLAEVARIVPEVRRHYAALPEPVLTSPGGASLLHEGVAQLLQACAEETPLVLAIDDVQWCDPDSGSLLNLLVQRLRGAPILWCITHTLGMTERESPAARLVRALRTAPHHVHLTLTALSRDEVWHLIRTLGRVSHPDGALRLAARVHAVTGGNPLYVIELLKTLFTRGWLVEDPVTREWTTSATGADELAGSEMFPSVRDAIAERVASLPDEQHALLLTIVASGSGCHTSLLSYVHGISRLRAAQLCDALVARHLVVESDGCYLCAHAVIAGVVLDTMGTSRRREVHRMIALALTTAAESMQQEADPGVIARHAHAGGERSMAHAYALNACEACTGRAAWEDALAWLDLAAATASTPDEIQATDRATAQVLARAGWSAPPPRASHPSSLASIGLRDLDLKPDASLQ